MQQQLSDVFTTPRDVDDIRYHYEINCQVIDLIPGHTEKIGVTGGEPTLMEGLFFDLIERLSSRLPATVAHILTNGRAFSRRSFTERFQSVNTPNVVLGIPLYSDYYARHDYVVQAKGAYNQTLLGLHNLGRVGARIEVRVVLHRLTYERLPQLAKFIFMNLPFVEQVSLMGLEYTGYTPYNDKILWIEPSEYVAELITAVEYLDSNGIRVSIYNHSLCTIPERLWKYSAKSISDWKRQYPNECGKCLVRDACGGVFATSKKLSSHIRPIEAL
ncbi:His-Xaa-Ser system radical SAM maturase HxsC [Salmonirosea aquatica]|uniref:His-Xaa-Ser system radical SAM maturase HxsC n=1 Tax=Salmonirosea aquatica TaxID=2654236 RepID=A0A7C9BMP2_9BACT|nr:His-Xaa-Ser system radical SAM maturase HxsC [Cytophagaceae bacterium SJW1-29]